MSALTVATVTGKKVSIEASSLDKLAASIQGHLTRPEDAGYDQARAVWNAMIDRKPALIVGCLGAADVVEAVNFAREHRLATAVRGCGHNIAGNAVCNDGVVIDLSDMNSVRIDPENRRAYVGPGATLGDFDREAQAFGLAAPLGINSTTGIGGLTLGGGFGWLSRKYGLTVDCLLGADVVTADGRSVRADKDNNPDLFWAIRGGGGNFGVVTGFEFGLHPVGPDIYSGLVVYSLDEGPKVLRKYREYVEGLGDETSVYAVLRNAPPLPFLPESVHGKGIVAMACFHGGDPEKGEKAIAPAREFGKVLGEHLGVQPYLAWQQAFDPLLTPGARNYWKSHNFAMLGDGAIDLAVEYTGRMPSDECEIFFGQFGGQISRLPLDATAYPHRNAAFVMNVHGRWQKPEDDARCVGWAREYYQKMAPFADGSVYVNFMPEDETDRVKAAYGANYQKLAATKKKYDPDNFFRLNQNISPGK
jgi:FAD/FMN-containing dehydrogenase